MAGCLEHEQCINRSDLKNTTNTSPVPAMNTARHRPFQKENHSHRKVKVDPFFSRACPSFHSSTPRQDGCFVSTSANAGAEPSALLVEGGGYLAAVYSIPGMQMLGRKALSLPVTRVIATPECLGPQRGKVRGARREAAVVVVARTWQCCSVTRRKFLRYGWKMCISFVAVFPLSRASPCVTRLPRTLITSNFFYFMMRRLIS